MATFKRGFRLSGLRRLIAQVAGPVRRMRRVEHPGGRDSGAGRRSPGAPSEDPADVLLELARGGGGRRAAASQHRIGGARSRARRRSRGGVGDPDRGRSRHRQVDSDVAIRRVLELGRTLPLCHRRGIAQAGGIARPAARVSMRRAHGSSPRPRSRPSSRPRRASRRARSSSIRSRPCIRTASTPRPVPSRSCASARPSSCGSRRAAARPSCWWAM